MKVRGITVEDLKDAKRAMNQAFSEIQTHIWDCEECNKGPSEESPIPIKP